MAFELPTLTFDLPTSIFEEPGAIVHFIAACAIKFIIEPMYFGFDRLLYVIFTVMFAFSQFLWMGVLYYIYGLIFTRAHTLFSVIMGRDLTATGTLLIL
jgi:hypothetical protein